MGWLIGSLDIPSTVKEIGTKVFFHSGVKEVVIPASALFAIDRSTFDRIDKKCTLYVPRGAKSAYASTLGWDNFTRIVEM